jgi:hypothetical protein
MSAPALQLATPSEFFRDKIAEAASNQKITISDDVEFYLVNLLCDYINPKKLESFYGQYDPLQTPIAFILKEAIEAPPTYRAKIYKFLGDTSLYLAGFFQDFFNRKTYDINYFIDMGQSAYSNVAVIMRDQHGDKHFSVMYTSLATQFNSLVEVVAEVSETPESARAADILSIYDRWTRTNSERLLRILQNAGISPVGGSTNNEQ